MHFFFVWGVLRLCNSGGFGNVENFVWVFGVRGMGGVVFCELRFGFSGPLEVNVGPCAEDLRIFGSWSYRVCV
jgi:hypothetical protein